MKILFSIIVDILHILGILVVCKYYLHLKEKNENKYIKILMVLLISIIGSFIANVIANRTIILIVYLLCIIIIMRVCYCESYTKILICTIWVSIIVEIIDIISMSITNTANAVAGQHNALLEELFAAVISVIFIYLVSILLKGISNDGIRNVGIRYLIFFTVILFVDFSILSLMSKATLQETVYKNKIGYIIVYASVVIGIFIQMASVILLLVSRNMHKENEQIINQCLDEQVKYYEYLKEKEQQTKKFRHDIRGHLYFLNELRKDGKDKEFDEYFKDIIGRVDDLGSNVNVGNDIVNAILNKAYSETKDRNIKMKIIGHFPTVCNISAYNLCTIFFNLLSNAIEAADKTTKREIWLVCQYTKREIIVEIGNYYCDKNKLDKDKLATTKQEKEYHGWGMKNVEDSVADCNGLMDIQIEVDRFVVSLTLNNEIGDIVK